MNVEFTIVTFRQFKAAYNQAVADKKEEFAFNGNVYILSYAKYLIEYLTTEFKK